MGVTKFEQDLWEQARKCTARYRLDDRASRLLSQQVQRLIDLRVQGWDIKSNHSVIEVSVAGWLVHKGWRPQLEFEMGGLICDVWASRGGKRLVWEVLTGYIPPANATDPLAYRIARDMAKVIRYSNLAGVKFGLVILPTYSLNVHVLRFFTMPVAKRDANLRLIKRLLDRYYKKPTISEDMIHNAHLDEIVIVNPDAQSVRRFDAEVYLARVEVQARFAYGEWASLEKI
jgi:hypothetical protein